jgi:hypothetical protein
MFFNCEPSDRSKLIDARAENARLREQLAKANDRVEELERDKEGCALRVTKQKEVIKRYESEAIEIAKAQERFAIENQCKAIDVFTSVFVESNYKHDVPVMGRVYNEKMREAILNALQKAAEKSIQKLRKGQASEYEFREIGESEWTPCDKDWFDYCQKSPEHDARLRKEQTSD